MQASTFGSKTPTAADDAARAGLERANAAIGPAARLASVSGAYWMMLGERRQLRWVLPEDESPLIDAMARLHADDDGQALELAEGTRFLGSFRASGLVVPVWDLAGGTEADEIEDAAASFRQRLDAGSRRDRAALRCAASSPRSPSCQATHGSLGLAKRVASL